MATVRHRVTRRASVGAALAALALLVCASRALSQAPSAELPTYRIGDKWIRTDGTWELTRIDGGKYVFSGGSEREIHFSKTLAVAKVVAAGSVHTELETPEMDWPLKVGKFAVHGIVLRRTPYPSDRDKSSKYNWNVQAFEDVTVPAGTFKAFRISNSIGVSFAYQSWVLWYAPDVRQYVKGQSPVPGLTFDLASATPTVPSLARADASAPTGHEPAAAPAELPAYKIGDRWIRSDGTYELKRIDKGVYVYEAGRGNEIRLSKNLEMQTVMRDGRMEVDLDAGLRMKWPLKAGQIQPYLSVWRGTGLSVPEGNIGSDVRISGRIEAESRLTVPAGTFRAHRIVYTGAGGPQYAAVFSDFISLWYSPEARRFVKGQSSRIAAMNFELTGLDDRAPPVVASAPSVAPPSTPRPAPTQPAPTPPAVVQPTPASPPVAAAPAPPPVVALELEGPPGAQVRIGGNVHALDAQGRLQLALSPGQHHIDATKEGFVPARQTITLTPGQAKVTQRLAMAQVVPPTITVLDPKPGAPVRTPDVRLRVEVKSAYRVSALRVGKEGDTAQQTFAPSAGVKAGEPWIVETVVSLAEGDNRVRLEAVDEHGGKTEQRATLARQSIVATPTPAQPPAPVVPPADNEAPKIALNYPPEGTKVDREQIVVLGLVTDNVAVDRVLVSVNGRMVAMSGEAAVSARSHSIRTPVALQPGDNVLEITAVDKAGNASQVVRMVTRASPVAAAPPPPPQPKYEQWAVVIGIGNYESPGIPRLRYTVPDADAVYRTLIGPAGFKKENVILLTDRSERKPTLKNIKWALGTFLARAARKDDTVFIFYAGHGAPEADARGLERDGLAKYLIPQDADPEDLFSTAFPMDDLQTIFGRIESERVVAFLDACYSGAAGGRTFTSKRTRAGAVDDLFLERLTRSRGRAIITASRPAEVSMELPDLGHGVFTYYLIEGLKGAADLNRDGIVTLQELYEYLEQQVTRKARSVGGNQHPVMKGELEGVLPLTKVRQP